MNGACSLAAWQVFATVADEGSLGAAAKVLGVSQQAVSARVGALERQTGVSLVERTPRGATLTPAGLAASEWASRLLAVAAEVDTAVAALRSGADSVLRIAASVTIAEYVLPGWLVALQASRTRQRREHASVDVIVANSSKVAELVQSGETEIGLVEGPEVPGDLGSRTIAKDRLVVVVAHNHPWARRRAPLPTRLLALTPLVSREHGSGTRDTLVSALERVLGSGFGIAAPALSLPSTAAVRAAVVAGLGPGVLSELAVADDVATARLDTVDVEGLDLTREFRAVWRRTRELSATGRQLIDLAVSAGSARAR